MIKYEHEDGTVAPALIVAESDDGKEVNLRVFGRAQGEADSFVTNVKKSSLKSWASTSSSSSGASTRDASRSAARKPAKKAARKSTAKRAPAKKAAAS